jgi:hypothetical protein
MTDQGDKGGGGDKKENKNLVLTSRNHTVKCLEDSSFRRLCRWKDSFSFLLQTPGRLLFVFCFFLFFDRPLGSPAVVRVKPHSHLF